MRSGLWIAVGLLVGCSGGPSVSEVEPLRGAFVVIEVDGAPVAPASAPSVVFGEDGRVTGDGGCNRFGGAFEQLGETIRLGPLMSSRRACEGPVMDLERRLLASLEAARSVAVEADGRLRIEGEAPHRVRLAPSTR